MNEKLPHPTIEHMLGTIESRVLLQLTSRMLENPEDILSEARARLEQDEVATDVVLTVEAYRAHEQRKVIKPKRDELALNIATVVMAHVWQNENNKARKHHKQLPH